MADINDRLDRLQRREEFDRRSAEPGWTPRPPAADPAVPVTRRPAGMDDRLGEVLDAVAAVVRRHPGLSVMVAVADGRPGRPVVRVTERNGAVETGVIVVGTAAVPAAQASGGPGTAGVGLPDAGSMVPGSMVPESVPGSAVPGAAGPDAATVPGLALMSSLGSLPRTGALPDSGTAPDGRARDEDRMADRGPAGRLTDASPQPAAGGRRGDGRHAVPHEDERRSEPGQPGWSGTSWHSALWSAGAQARFRSAEGGPPMQAGHRRSDPAPDQDRLRLVADEQPAEADDPQPQPDGTVPLPADTSKVVSRLAELLRENPTLTANWSREAPE